MFCRKLMGDRDSGDDLYQDALVTAFTKFNDLREISAFRPWLYRILVNTFKSTVRRPWWKRRTGLTPDIELRLTGEDPIDAHNARRWLQVAFQTVTPDEQALVSLHELDGWSIGELSKLYGKKEGAIKVRLFRARRKMKDALISFSQRSQIQNTAKTAVGKDNQCATARPSLD